VSTAPVALSVAAVVLSTVEVAASVAAVVVSTALVAVSVAAVVLSTAEVAVSVAAVVVSVVASAVELTEVTVVVTASVADVASLVTGSRLKSLMIAPSSLVYRTKRFPLHAKATLGVSPYLCRRTSYGARRSSFTARTTRKPIRGQPAAGAEVAR
jgi:hypothetical protein